MDTTKPIYPRLPYWIAALYTVFAIVLVPWIGYLAVSLPQRHLSTHWDISWVGLDVAIACMLLLNALFSYLESKWLVISATMTTTLLCADAWFDIMSAHQGAQFIGSLASALFVELPLAAITFWVALRIVHREHHSQGNRSMKKTSPKRR